MNEIKTTALSGPLLSDRVAVITGGGGGIGAATARLFAHHAANVVIAEIDQVRADEVAEEINAAGGRATAVVTDVCDAEQIERLRTKVIREWGRVDILVNNVGHYVERPRKEFADTDPEVWKALHEINFLQVIMVTHAFLPSMIENRSGAIINVSSIEGLRGYPADPVYAAYKAAVVQFTRCLAVQVGRHGVRVNGIGPDVTESLQVQYSKWIVPEFQHLWPLWVPIGRMGIPEDQARVLLFLASDLSGFVTGLTIPTDGGTAAAGGWYRSQAQTERTWTNRPINP
jgi:meso-butanediol dehydrogenase/(S,S)-butanediol dehydrogenase/diacetyl reductase